MTRAVQTVEDLLAMLDAMFAPPADRWTERAGAWWDGFYQDRGRAVAFFRPVPDESLVSWHRSGQIAPRPGGRALDLLERALAPGGWFALSAFAAGEMGSDAPDESFYREGHLTGGWPIPTTTFGPASAGSRRSSSVG